MSDALATLEIPLDRRPYLNLSSLLFRRAGGPADAADDQVAVLRAGVSLLVMTELDVEDPGASVLARPGDRFVVFRVIRGQQDVVVLRPPAALVGFIVDRKVLHATGNRVFVVADGHGDILVALAI